MINIVINGKFLRPGAPRSGVYRVAHELLHALDKALAENPDLASKISCRVIVPADIPPELALSRVRVESSGGLADSINDTLWEQILLPWHARGSILLNLCNMGPVFYRNAFTMFHDAQVHSSPDSYSFAFRAWYWLVQPLLGRRNRAIFTVSQYSCEQLDRYRVVAASRVRVIHNGCDHVLRVAPDTGAVRTVGLANKRYVLALANTQVHKNVGMLLKAFRSASLKDVTLALYGAATRADFEALGHSVPANVLFLGRLTDEQLFGLLKQATALAFPSLTEGFGLPPLEAMALGCPAIVAPCGALPEVCGDAALWADPHQPDQWAHQIARLLDDPKHKAATISLGFRRAAVFTWEQAVRQLLTTVLGTDSGPTAGSVSNFERTIR